MSTDFLNALDGIAFFAIIFGFHGSILLFISWWIAALQRCKNYGSLMFKFALGLGLLTTALMFGQHFVKATMNNVVVVALYAVLTAAIITLGFLAYFTPSFIAWREDRKLFWYVLPLNLMMLNNLTFWVLALVGATMPAEVWRKLDKKVMGKRLRKTAELQE